MLCSNWVTGADVLQRPGCDQIDKTVAEQSAVDASALLYALSGRQFPGTCSETLRPMARPSSQSPRAYYGWLGGIGWGGSWFAGSSWGVCYGASSDHAGCQQPFQVDLLRYPVRSITQVLVDGQTVPPSSYRLDDDRVLVRTDGQNWPTCQDIRAPDSSQGTFSISFSYGADPPADGIGAAITMASELAKARSNLRNRLPSRINNISREGISMTILDPMPFIQSGLTGIYEVDLFIKAWNPKAQQQPTVVYSPDLQAMRRSGTQYPY